MARPSNVEVLGRYRKRVEVAKQWRREEGYDDTWHRLIDMYRGKQYEYASPEDRMTVNISFSTVNVIAPSVAVNYPKITVNAAKPEDAPRAIITEAVINYWWKHYKVRPQFRRSVKDFLIVGHGWLKCGYRYVEEAKIGSDDDINDAEAPGGTSTSTTVVVEDRPFVERVSVFDIFVDPDATSMEDARWIAQRIKRPLQEVKTDKRYLAATRSEISVLGAGVSTDRYHTAEKVVDEDQGYVEVWEFYDIVKNTMCVFADGADGFLVKPMPMPYAFGHPFLMIRNYDVPDQFYPMGDLEAIEPMQRELNETRTQMMNHRKRYARKYLFRESSFDTAGRGDLESDVDNVMVKVIGDEPLNNVVVPFPSVMTPPEFYNQSQMIQGDVANVSGVSEYQRGALPEIRRTATEASIVQDASNARAADKLATIEAAIGCVAQNLVALAQEFMTGEQVARVVGKDGAPLWVTFDADYIKGEFDFEVEAGSTQPNNESFRRQSALQLVDALAPFAQAGVINMEKLAVRVMQFGFGIKDPESYIMAPPPQDGSQGMPQDPNAPQGMQPQGGAPPEGAAPQGIDPEVAAQLADLIHQHQQSGA